MEGLRRVLFVSAVVVATALGAAWLLQRRLIYFPSTSAPPPASSVLPGSRDVVLQTRDGLDLGAWFVPAREPARGWTVLVASGNAGDRSLRAPLAQALAARGLDVLLFDYRGYGGNPGSPSEQGLAADVRAARSFLLDEMRVAPDRLLYLGESLGSAVITELASEHPPAGLVLRSPFVDLACLAQVHYGPLPVRLLLRDEFRLVDHLAQVRVPVTVVYGSADTIVPPEQSRAVLAAAPEPEGDVVVPGADHNDAALASGDMLVTAVVDLVVRLEGPGGPARPTVR